jgi:hypothetical protein
VTSWPVLVPHWGALGGLNSVPLLRVRRGGHVDIAVATSTFGAVQRAPGSSLSALKGIGILLLLLHTFTLTYLSPSCTRARLGVPSHLHPHLRSVVCAHVHLRSRVQVSSSPSSCRRTRACAHEQTPPTCTHQLKSGLTSLSLTSHAPASASTVSSTAAHICMQVHTPTCMCTSTPT